MIGARLSAAAPSSCSQPGSHYSHANKEYPSRTPTAFLGELLPLITAPETCPAPLLGCSAAVLAWELLCIEIRERKGKIGVLESCNSKETEGKEMPSPSILWKRAALRGTFQMDLAQGVSLQIILLL